MSKTSKLFNNSTFILLLTEVIVLLPKLYVITLTIPFTDIRDEVSMLAVPAYLAGYSWECMETASYYGFGFFSLFAPLFCLGKDITWIYKTILLVTAIVEGIIPWIIQYILKKYFEIYDNLKLFFISVFISYITVNPLYNLINEHILIILTWIITLIFFKLIFEKTAKEKIVYSGCLALVFMYGLTIHTRFLTVIIAAVLVILLYRILYKEWIVAKFFWCIFLCGYLCAEYIIGVAQNAVWGSTSLANASVEISVSGIYSGLEMIIGFGKVLLGNLGTLFVFSKGFVPFILVAIVYFCLLYFSKKDNKNICAENKQSRALVMISIIFILCVGATLLILCIQNGHAFQGPYDGKKNTFPIKALTYLRYYLLYTGPLFFMGCVTLIKYSFIYKKTYKVSLILNISILCLWVSIIAPIIADSYLGVSSFYPFSCILRQKTKLGVQDFRTITLLIINFSLLAVFIYRKFKGTNAIFLIITLLFIDQYVYFAQYCAIPVAKSQYEEIDKTVEFVNAQEKQNITLYVYDKENRLPFLYQAYFYQYEVQNGIPENECDNDIVLSNEKIDDLLESGWIETEIDKNEWIYYHE